MKSSPFQLAFLAAALLPVSAFAVNGYVTDPSVRFVVENNFSECIHTSEWTPEMAIPECEPNMVKKPVVAAPVPVAAPVLVAAPAPVVAAPAPVVQAPKPVVAETKPAPAPEQMYKTVLTEKPVRLEGATFASGSAKLLSAADAKLAEVVEAANKYPDINLVVSGHTDDRGRPESNQHISNKRAEAVKIWLVKHGVAANRISTAGYGETQPMADNATEGGRAANRRVEVRYDIKEEKKVRVTQ